jgi:non-specific serine/threonine protein kinase
MLPKTTPFATLLRNERRAAGLTQADLAERASISVRGLQHLEAGDASPTQATLHALAGALALPIEERRRFEAAASAGRRAFPSDLSPTPPSRAGRDARRTPQIPVELTPLVGRVQELRALRQLLPRTRLLTLTGTGGCGKTRLALHLAHNIASDFDGVWLVELAAVSQPDMIPRALAQAGGVSEEPGHALISTCLEVLRQRRLLLILDNCEHLLETCASLADTLLRSCPQLTILATSREPLGIQGEHPWRVPSLTVPGTNSWSLSQHEQYGAVELFVQRAAVMQPGFVVTERNAPAIAEICRRLDGIPLALELAAALLRALGVEQLRDRLSDQLSLLTSGNRAAPPRQQTLRATLDWSYRLLDDHERQVLARLAVFSGRSSLEAVEAVACGPDVPVSQVLGLLARLVDRSLVVSETPVDGPSRYHLLETVRQYALERLMASGSETAARARHAVHYVALAEQAEPELTSASQIEWLERLEIDRENLRSALTWTVNSGNAELALRLASGLLWWWITRGHRQEGLDWLRTLLALPAQVEPQWRVKALHAAGTLAWIQGFQQEARTFYAECLSISQQCGDRAHCALALDGLGRVAIAFGEPAQGRAHENASLAIQRSLGNHHAAGYALFFLGSAALAEDAIEDASLQYRASLEEFRLAQDRFGQANALRALGNVARRDGDLAGACELEKQSLALAGVLGNLEGVTLALDVLGAVAMDAQDYSAARAYFAEGLVHLRDLGARSRISDSLEWFALLAEAEGETERATRLVGAATAVRESSGVTVPVARPRTSAIHLRSLSSPTDARALREGRTLSLADAVAYALDRRLPEPPAAISP